MAQDVNGVTIPGYVGTATLAGAGDGGIVDVAPAMVGPFFDGRWTGEVTVNTVDTNVALRIEATQPQPSLSNAFNVEPGVESPIPVPATRVEDEHAGRCEAVFGDSEALDDLARWAWTAELDGLRQDPPTDRPANARQKAVDLLMAAD